MPSPSIPENVRPTEWEQYLGIDLEMGLRAAIQDANLAVDTEERAQNVPDAKETPKHETKAESQAPRRVFFEPKLPALVARIQSARPRVEQFKVPGYTCPRITSSIPPPNFGAVVKGKIYRSGFPSVENLQFMETLGLRTILTLVEGPYPEEYSQWIVDNFKDHYTVPLPANKDVVCIKIADMAKAMAVVTNPDNYPLLIHCNKGKHRTGCVVGAFRKCTGVKMEEILSEYHDYASNKARVLDETFLKNVQPFELMYSPTDDVRHDSATESDSAFLKPLPRIIV